MIDTVNFEDDSNNLITSPRNVLLPNPIFQDVVRAARVAIFGGSKLNVLLLFGPFAIFGKRGPQSFLFSAITLIPSAERLAYFTEHVASHTNETYGGLLNATFGNVSELIISVFAMKQGYYRIVQLSLLGSIITNLLFVFGCSCFVGGIRWQVQTIRQNSGSINSGMLIMATAGLLLPAALKMSGQEDDLTDELYFSRFTALVMTILYFAYLCFQLKTHVKEFDTTGPSSPSQQSSDGVFGIILQQQMNRITLKSNIHLSDDEKSPQIDDGNRIEPFSQFQSNCRDEQDDDLVLTERRLSRPQSNRRNNKRLPFPNMPALWENSTPASFLKKTEAEIECSNHLIYPLDIEQEQLIPPVKKDYYEEQKNSNEDEITLRAALVWLLLVSVYISVMSDVLIGSIGDFASEYEISEVFTAAVILPVFSNFAEQSSAVYFAYKNKMNLCIAITLGSAIQIALQVLPGCVLYGWAKGKNMTLFFHGYETASLVVSVLLVSCVLQGGTTNWLVGIFLMGTYFIVASGFWFHEMELISNSSV